MSERTFAPGLTVAEALKRWDQTAAAFIRLRMACVGCPLSPFETLETAAQIYGLPPDALIRELESALAAQPRSERMSQAPNREEDERTMGSSNPNQHKKVDVRSLAPMHRHPTIFDAFAALRPGEAFELVNDHDPKPLYYQFQAEHTGEFTWEYLEQGPQVWRVAIGKKA